MPTVVYMILTMSIGVRKELYGSVRKGGDAGKVYRLGLSLEVTTLILSWRYQGVLDDVLENDIMCVRVTSPWRKTGLI